MDSEKMKSTNLIKVGGVNEHFNLPWIKLCEESNSKSISDLTRENNFKLDWKTFAGGTGVLTTALQNNEIDIAVLLTEGLLLDIIKNKNLSLICFHVSNPLRWAIHIRKNDLENFSFGNKKFAISRFGSGSHTMAKFLLNEKNIPYDDKLMVEVGSLEGGLKSVEENIADIFLWEKFTTQPFLEEHNLIANGEVLTPWPPFSVATTKIFQKENPELLKEIISEVKSNSQKILNNSSTLSELNSRWKIENENSQRWLSEIIWDDELPVNQKKLASVLDNMKKAGLIDKIPNDLNLFLN
jgi:sulfonate transport system substrate-binding protein